MKHNKHIEFILNEAEANLLLKVFEKLNIDQTADTLQEDYKPLINMINYFKDILLVY